MVDDILARLRRAFDETGDPLLSDALNEITRLRKQRERIKEIEGARLETLRQAFAAHSGG